MKLTAKIKFYSLTRVTQVVARDDERNEVYVEPVDGKSHDHVDYGSECLPKDAEPTGCVSCITSDEKTPKELFEEAIPKAKQILTDIDADYAVIEIYTRPVDEPIVGHMYGGESEQKLTDYVRDCIASHDDDGYVPTAEDGKTYRIKRVNEEFTVEDFYHYGTLNHHTFNDVLAQEADELFRFNTIHTVEDRIKFQPSIDQLYERFDRLRIAFDVDSECFAEYFKLACCKAQDDNPPMPIVSQREARI